jgi:TM2 domain-containing membrane protein YozV
MIYPDSVYTARMNDQQRAWFYAEYERARKDEIAGVLFALFLGGFGIHYFYLGRNGLGLTYLLLSWTGIPSVLGLIEAFFMPSRVRAYNVAMASMISTHILAGAGMPVQPVAGVPVSSI